VLEVHRDELLFANQRVLVAKTTATPLRLSDDSIESGGSSGVPLPQVNDPNGQPWVLIPIFRADPFFFCTPIAASQCLGLGFRAGALSQGAQVLILRPC